MRPVCSPEVAPALKAGVTGEAATGESTQPILHDLNRCAVSAYQEGTLAWIIAANRDCGPVLLNVGGYSAFLPIDVIAIGPMNPDLFTAPTLDGLPDLLLLLRRDGVLLAAAGGGQVGSLRPPADSVGLKLDSLWPEATAQIIRRLVRQALSSRGVVDAAFRDGDHTFEARVSAQGPERALCLLRRSSVTSGEETDDSGQFAVDASRVERRSFVRRFKESMSIAALRERPTAVAVIYVDGIVDLSRIIHSQVAEEVMRVAMRRLQELSDAGCSPGIEWYAGRLNDNLLVLVLESRDRAQVEEIIARTCDRLREPVEIGHSTFHLSPYAGIAILGRDADSPKMLLNCARVAAGEAKRAGVRGARVFTDTVRLRSLARTDIAKEMRDAIENREVRLRYSARRNLATGALVAAVGYMRWIHPLRGEVYPAEFLGVAETTGAASSLSRAVLQCLRENYPVLCARAGAQIRVSFGPLRHHILQDGFFDDIMGILADGGLPPDRLELRIGERSLVACDPGLLESLARRGVSLIVDEVGRGLGSFDLLARAPLAGLQLDRQWIQGLPHDPAALKICRAAIGLARGIGLPTFARGVDHAAQHDILVGLGCEEGIGEFYGTLDPVDESAAPAAASWP